MLTLQQIKERLNNQILIYKFEDENIIEKGYILIQDIEVDKKDKELFYIKGYRFQPISLRGYLNPFLFYSDSLNLSQLDKLLNTGKYDIKYRPILLNTGKYDMKYRPINLHYYIL